MTGAEDLAKLYMAKSTFDKRVIATIGCYKIELLISKTSRGYLFYPLGQVGI